MVKKEKNIWIFLIFLLSGLVVGGLLGQIANNVDFLSWLAYGESFGLNTPVVLDLSVLQITFGLVFNINVASIIGMVLAVIIYRKV